MSTLYTQDASPTNPFGIGFYEQAVATSQRLIREREALEAQLLPQINDGPFAFSAVRTARNEFRALEANPAADPAALAAAKAKFEELDSGRARLTAQQEQNARLLEQTREGLVTNQSRLAEAQAKAASQPANRPIVNAGDDPAANSAPPVVSPTNITGTEPPLDVTTPDASSPAPVPRSAIEEGGDAEAQEALAVRNAEAAAADDPFETARLAREAEEPPPTFEAEDLEDSPYEVARLAGEEEGDGPTLEAPDPADDPYEAARLAGEEGEPPPTLEAEDLEDSPYEIARQAGEDAEGPPAVFEAEDLEDSPYEVARRAGEEEEPPPTLEAAPVPDTKYDEFGNVVPNTPEAIAAAEAKAAEQRAAEEQAAAKLAAINQATLQSVYKAVGSSDWRVRLQLAPGSNYLYNVPANPNDGTGPGILGPLAATNGVIFPYTPQINTSYKANYEQYDLVHSNYRGVYYKNSRVDDLSIRGVFTAQDTREADYLLAVIHFFRSVTKMFYGKDEQRGSPPPLVYLSGLGMNQFFGHPCVVSSFQYNLPDQVDYIRATSVNNYGTDLLSRRTPGKASGAAGLGATGNRILNAGLERFFPAAKPAPDPVVGSVNNTQLANYVPTKMEIDITLIPVQTRSQVSKQFSLKGFANGDLIKGGFW